MTRTYSPVTVGTMLAVVFAVASHAAAQCPTTIPQSVLSSVQTPEIRTAAQTFRLDAAMIAQNGGLPKMIQLAKEQLAADRTTVIQEQTNQAYLAQNGMRGDRRAADGRSVIQMLQESQRLTAASIELMECHARLGTSGGAGSQPSALSGEAFAQGSVVASRRTPMDPSAPGGNFSQALESLSRTMRDKAMVNADPAVAAFWAKQDALRARNEENAAAMSAGRARGLDDARRGSLDAQMKMVKGAVNAWQPPRAYAAGSSINPSAIQDPFTRSLEDERLAALRQAIELSGLAWNPVRHIAQAGANGSTCGGRLQHGDYPVLRDGNLLDTPERVAVFLATCGNPSIPLFVARESGDVEVRK